MPYVSVSARFTLKEPPKGKKGLRGEHWHFGKDTEMSLHDLGLMIFSRLAEFYLVTMPDKSIEEINANIKRLSETLGVCGIREDNEAG